MEPTFPIFVLFDDGDIWILEAADEVAASLEWLDTDHADGTIRVFDWEGRPVSLAVEGLEIKRLAVQGQPDPDARERLRKLLVQPKPVLRRGHTAA